MPANIVNYVIPSQLYRYRSLRRIGEADDVVLDRELAAIEQGYIWASSFQGMNDPMEGVFSTGKNIDPGKRRIIDQMKWQKESTGICCFSETPTNELMWAHYADEFRGICIAYDFSNLRESLIDDAQFTRLFYSESQPRLNLTRADLETSVRRVLSSKSQKWSYEREWRLFASQAGAIYYNNESVIKTIYVGSRIDSRIKKIISQRTQRINITISEMNLRGYRIAFDNTSARYGVETVHM